MRTGCRVASGGGYYLLSENRFNVAMHPAFVRCLLRVLIMISFIMQRGISCPGVYGTCPNMI